MEKKKNPAVFAVSGVKNSGKTTLITRLLPFFTVHGWKVATVKHDGHDFEPDVPGTDTYAHRQAGAYGTAIFSDNRFMVVKEMPVTERELFAAFPEADLILLEGLKNSSYPKLEIVREGNSSQSVCPRNTLVAIATDRADRGGFPDGVPVVDLNDTAAVAAVICEYVKRQKKQE